MLPPSHISNSLPLGAKDILRANHPSILALKLKYSTVDNASIFHSAWTDEYVESQIEWPYFRGDNAYIWQVRDDNYKENYQITTDYIRSRDRLDLLNKLNEDGAFGAYCYLVDDRLTVSRDLLDSILEMYFLDDQLNLSNWSGVNILDIGAGYGRLAHRIATAMRNIGKYYCVDAVAESTFLSNYYLSYREVTDKTEVLLLDEIEHTIKDKKIDVAINVHSFSECCINAIEWWITLLRKNQVKYIMIVPNAGKNGGEQLISMETRESTKPYEHLLDQNGYQLICRQKKYLVPFVQERGISPTYYYLYELVG